MASFPTTNITYANRSAGQAIASAHINSLQDEVAAIELGYLTGTARLNAGGSTLASLSVTGGSTLASLLVSGVATFSTKVAPASTTVMVGDSTTGFKEVHCSSLYVNGVAVTGGVSNPPVAKVNVSSDVQFTGSASWLAAVNWDINVYDSTGMHSTGANSSRITFVGSTGIYHVGACLTSTWAGESTASLEARIVLNDSTSIVALSIVPNAQPSARQGLSLSADFRVAALTDWVTLQYRPGGSGSTGRLLANSTIGPTAMWVHRISS